ncbi:PREDICTED: F-box/kelch-repeat protein At3g04660-like [Camelina sativa]|uniref:F-box/kelch-repeat protein At3g04660-like n=1 Tax=Camelina sativa TaxID=90675 RepID=A0ABM0WAC7_CAMSA|nr:PREDICTED: F-box/kelch-repeat protein At3g04660-like [Camelina sativa]
MKRVRTTKETLGDSRKRSKKHDETHSFPFIPQDLIVQILLNVPARSTARFVIVSKEWFSIIRSKDFTRLYLTRSSTRPRLLFSVYNHFHRQGKQFLQSFFQQDPSSDHHQRVYITSHHSHLYGFSPPVRGLICRKCGTNVIIGNPSTGQFLPLPRVKTYRRGLFTFFGYDPVNDVYKVLCMTVLHGHQRRGSRYVSEEHQVFTLGAKQKWRMIKCKRSHLPPPYTRGICINGVVHYFAWIEYAAYLVRFDLSSEDFSFIKLPQEIECLVNYNGKIALTKQCMSNSKLDIWVLEDASKGIWSKFSVLVPSWTDLVGNNDFVFRGTLSTGELIFAPLSVSPISPVYLISFNLNDNNAKKVLVEGLGDLLSLSRSLFGSCRQSYVSVRCKKNHLVMRAFRFVLRADKF